MSVVTVGSCQRVESTGIIGSGTKGGGSCVKHLGGPQEASEVFYGSKCVFLLHWNDCDHCKAFLPVYEKTAAENRNVTFYALEVTLAQPESEMPSDQFFEDKGVPRVAVTEHGKVLQTVKGNDQKGFLKMLGKFFGVNE